MKGYPHATMDLAYFRMKFSSEKMKSDVGPGSLTVDGRLDAPPFLAAPAPLASLPSLRASSAASLK